MVNIVNPLCLTWFFPVWSRNDILFPETFAVVIETRRQVMKSHVDRQYLKICNATFKRTVSLFHSAKALTRKFFPNYNLAMFFFVFIDSKDGVRRRGGQCSHNRNGARRRVWLSCIANIFCYGPIWNYIKYVAEEKFHSSMKRYRYTRMLTLALHRLSKLTTLSCNSSCNLAEKKNRVVKHF